MGLKIESLELDLLTSDPGSPVEGQVWFNTTEKKLKLVRNSIVRLIETRQNDFAAVVDPLTTDDEANGYEVGSKWINTVDDTVWFCMDAATNLAVWQKQAELDQTTIVNEIFGDFADDDSLSTTASATFIEKLKMTSDPVEAGEYIIFYHALLQATTGNGRLEVRCQLDDVTLLGGLSVEPGGSNLGATFAGHKTTALLAGVHTIDIDWKKTAGGGNIEISQTRLALWRIA